MVRNQPRNRRDGSYENVLKAVTSFASTSWQTSWVSASPRPCDRHHAQDQWAIAVDKLTPRKLIGRIEPQPKQQALTRGSGRHGLVSIQSRRIQKNSN